jgi:formate hydrogenlyase subunit 6/NADH:ubiquinone oxidoreductase subunit I
MRLPGKMAGEVLRHVTRTPATVLYPFVKVQMPPEFRGKMVYLAEKCNGCKLCSKDCPSGALTINKVGDKRMEAVFDLDKCIYCGQCADSCNKDAIIFSPEYELASLTRATLKFTFHAPPAPPATSPAAAPQTPAPPVAASPAPAASASAGEPQKPVEPAKDPKPQ